MSAQRHRPAPAPDRNGEAQIQAAIVKWVRTVAPDVLIFSIPNGGLRTKAEAARLKWTGTLAGVPDLAIVAPGGRAHFLEVKTTSGRLSEAQRDVIGALAKVGAPVMPVCSIDDVRRAFSGWAIETREARP
jgi:hypothetical protein